MPTRFSAPSQSHTGAYADMQALQQLRGRISKSKAQLQRKPRHLEPVQQVTTNQRQHGLIAAPVDRHLQSPHLLDAEVHAISSKQLRSLVSGAAKYAAQEPQRHPARQADSVLSRLDAQSYTPSSNAASLTPVSVSALDRQQRGDECGRKSHHVGQVHALQELRVSKPHAAALTRAPPSNQARMQSMDLSSMHGTTLARYRRLVGMVARKSLTQMLHTMAKNVVFLRLQHRCATRIQTAAIGFLTQRRELQRHIQVSMAVVVQCAWKSCQARRQAVRLKSDRDRLQNLTTLREKRSAIVIQQAYQVHSEWKVTVKRRAWACTRLAATWRSKKRENASPEHKLSVLCSKREQLCGELQQLKMTQDPDSSSPAVERCRKSLLQPDNCERVDAPVCYTAQELLEFAPRAPELMPNRQREEDEEDEPVGHTSHPPATFEVLSAPRIYSDTSNPDQKSNSDPFTKIEELCAAIGVDSIGTTPYPIDEPTRPSPLLNTGDRTSVGELPVQVTYNYDVSWSDSSSSEDTNKLAVVSSSPASGSRAAAQDARNSATRVLKQCLPAWMLRVRERIRREREEKIHASVRIQCRVRQRLAANRVRLVRQLAICSLRAEVKRVWGSALSGSHSTRGEQSDWDPSSEDEDEESEDGGPSLAVPRLTCTIGHQSFLPTRNGQIPPGVSRHQLHASLWSWSWGAEAWTAS